MAAMNRAGLLLRRWRRAERGSITIEFLLWLPLLAFWLVVSVAFFDAYKSRNDAAKAAHTLSDIMSRQVEMSNAFADELFALEDKLLPRVATGKRLRVSSIRYAAETYQVQWSRAVGGGQPMADADIPLEFLPEMADLDTVVLTELYVPYQPFTDWAGIGARAWTFVIVTRPRFVSAIGYID